jgi:outer membrane protein assembly factor BamB
MGERKDRRSGLRGYGSAARLLAALAAFLALAQLPGCASNKDPANQPAPLQEIRKPVAVRVAWRLSLGGARGGFLQPAVTDNAIYAAAGEGGLIRIDPASGRQVWRTEVGSPIAAGVGSDGLTVAVVSPRGDVLAFGVDGKPLWRANVPSDVTATPLVGHGLVIVQSTDHRVSAFETATGKRRWLFQRTQPPLTLRAVTQMAFSGDNVLVGLPAGRLLALALANGAVRWDAAVAEPRGATEVERLTDVTGTLALAGADACAAAYQGRVACVDASNGNLRWARDLPAASGVALDGEQAYVVDVRSGVNALARESNGASVWRNTALANRKLTGALALPRAVVVADFDGYVHFLSPRDGALIARVATDGGAVTVAPQAWANAAVVQTAKGTLMLLQMGS